MTRWRDPTAFNVSRPSSQKTVWNVLPRCLSRIVIYDETHTIYVYIEDIVRGQWITRSDNKSYKPSRMGEALKIARQLYSEEQKNASDEPTRPIDTLSPADAPTWTAGNEKRRSAVTVPGIRPAGR
jgi:hypothetical protein